MSDRKSCRNGVELAGTHQTNSAANRFRDSVKNVHGRIEPVCEPFFATPRFVETGDLLSEHSEDSIGGITGFEPAKQWVRGKVLPCFLFIDF